MEHAKCNKCDYQNLIHARYCVQCSEKLTTYSPWAMSGCNTHRTSCYQTGLRSEFSQHRIQNDLGATGLNFNNLPEPIMAYSSFWYWNFKQKNIEGYILYKDESPKHITTNIVSQSVPDISNSLGFDGVFINGICNDEFFRISINNGEIIKKISDTRIASTTKAAPIIAEVESPDDQYQPFRYFIIPLKSDVLIVDISQKGHEQFHFIPWAPSKNTDVLRSPVQYKDHVLLLSSLGQFYAINIKKPLIDIINENNSLKLISSFNDFFHFAPAVIGKFLCWETMGKEPIKSRHSHLSKSSYYKRGFFSLALNDDNAENHKHHEFSVIDEKYFIDSGFRASLSDGRSLYVQDKNRKNTIYKCIPCSSPLNLELKVNDREMPVIDSRNSITIKENLYVVDEPRWRLREFSVRNRIEIRSDPILVGSGGSHLHGRPIVFANLMAIMLNNKILFLDIGRDGAA